jgi:hypothetical protein
MGEDRTFDEIMNSFSHRLGMKQDWHDFIVFLHEEGVYKEYRENLYVNCLQKKKDSIYLRIERMKQHGSYISSAFVWDETPQGHWFWSAINNKWREKRREIS